MTAPAGLAATDLTFDYGPRSALRAVSLAASPGEIVGILGPNGSGKTTLLRCMLGFLRPRSGRVTLDGADISSFSRREFARRVAAVPQETPTDFPLRVDELALLGRLPHLPGAGLGFEGAGDLEAADAAMAACGVNELRTRRLHELSGGELRRAFIARALAQLGGRGAGCVLLLDEPTSGLDLRHQAAIAGLLRDAARRGTAVLIVLHDLNLAATLCDRVALLKDGALVAAGTPGAVLTGERLGAVYEVEVRVVELPARPGQDAQRLVMPPGRPG